MEEGTKLAPVTVMVNAAPPAKAEPGLSDVAVGVGLGFTGGDELPVWPPHPARQPRAVVHRIVHPSTYVTHRGAAAREPGGQNASSNSICPGIGTPAKKLLG